jgi:hypothetical protein
MTLLLSERKLSNWSTHLYGISVRDLAHPLVEMFNNLEVISMPDFWYLNL